MRRGKPVRAHFKRFELGQAVWHKGRKWEVADHLNGSYALWSQGPEHKTEHAGWVNEEDLTSAED